MSIDNHQIEHLGLRKHLDGARGNLTAKRLVTTKQKLLTGLAACVKSSGDLRAAERPVGKQTPILSCKRHPLFDALIDDQIADLSKAINICFARAKIAAFDCVVKQAINTVAIVLIIFRGIDSTLCRDRMCTTR